jgi:23S rRNA (adenine2503-C2)-methyltransferase
MGSNTCVIPLIDFCNSSYPFCNRCAKGIPAKINLIPFNPWPSAPYECSDWSTIEQFSDIVFNAGYASPVRTPRGRDIYAACGQLKSETEKLRARIRMTNT